MDPEANMQEQAAIRQRIKAKAPNKGDYGRLKELQAALREWQRNGGFSPKKIVS